MERKPFHCLICSEEFTSVIKFKQHLHSSAHRQQYKKVYPIDVFKRNKRSYTPSIFINDPHCKLNCSRPILGLSQMTLCFSSEVRNAFYLCHVCEQKFHFHGVVSHLCHVNHYSNYFAYTDPNALTFLSVPTEQNLHISLIDNIRKEHEQKGIGELQILHMPDRLFNECTTRNYCQVMFLLYQNKSLSNIFKESKPERMRIQTYKDGSNRMHPLIGLQHIVECICNLHTHLRTYLCTLCNLQLSSNMIIRHLLTFNHVFAYISTWNPCTLKEKERYRKDFAPALADLAKQSEELHGPQEIQQVKLDTSQMLLVLNAHFKQALAKVESIANKGSLTTTPGNKLEPTLPSNIMTNVKQESVSEPVTSENTNLTQNIKAENEESTIEQSTTPAAPSYSFYCQNCSKNFDTNALYVNHLLMSEHLENLTKTFGAAMDKSGECKPHFHSFEYFTEPDVLCAGVSLVVTVLSRQLNDDPVHLCFACETVFSRRDLKSHMNSERHLVQFLMYQNPWKLPFAWKTKLDYPTLKLKACAEEEERRPIKNIKILDVPPSLFPCGTLLSFSNVMEKLSQYHPVLKNGVPQQETYSKLQDNDGFPILGRDFLVKHGEPTSGWKFLCLLCQRSLSSDDFTGHVFSWEHVVAFLEKIHPGTLDLNTTDEEMLLDFAKQAARFHSVSNAQEIKVDITSTRHSIVIMDHSTKVRLLTVEKERNGEGPLMPSITPRMKLFPRQQTQPKELNLDIKTTNPEMHPENPVEKLVDGVQSTEQVSHEPVDISLQEKNNLPTQQKLKNSNPMNPPEPSQSEELKSSKNSSSDCKATMNTATVSKKPRSESDMDTSDSEKETQMPKRMRLSNLNEKEPKPNIQNMDTAKQCKSSDTAVDTSVACYDSELLSYVKKKSRDPVIGLNAIYECVFNDSPPIYLCECCHLKFKSQHITKHLSETWHYVSYLKRAGEDQPPSNIAWRRDMAQYAAYWETRKGYGETRVVKLMKEDYDKIEKASTYYEAVKIVRKYPTTKANCSPALRENLAKVATANRQETSQQAIQMKTDRVSLATSSNIGTILTQTSDLDQSTAHETDPDIVSQSLDSTVTVTSATPALSTCLKMLATSSNMATILTQTSALDQSTAHETDPDIVSQSLDSTVTITSASPALSSSSLLGSAKSVPQEESESTKTEDPNLKMENIAHTQAPSLSKPLCKFIVRSGIPEVDFKPVNTQENSIDEIEYTAPASCITVTPKPTLKPVCKFMPARSVKNKSTSAVTTHASTCNPNIVTPNTQQTPSSLLVDKVKSRTPSPDLSVSNAMEEDDASVKPDVLKVETTSLSGTKTATESCQTKLPSAAPTAPTPKTTDAQSKPKKIQLKLNVNAASLASGSFTPTSGSFTPTTPSPGLLMPTAETSQKPTAQTLQVGVDQLVKVKCNEKRLVYCLACSKKLDGSNHRASLSHQMKCVKMKFPWWNAEPGQEELSKMVALLHDDEKALKVDGKQIDVNPDIYQKLKLLSEDKAIEEIKNLMKRKSSKKPVRLPSTSTSETSNSLCDISTSPNIAVSSRDVKSPDLGNENCQTNPQIKNSAQPLKKMPVTATSAPIPSSPVHKPASKVAPKMIKGLTTDDRSNLSHFLKVRGTSVIGLCLVWECRSIPPIHRTFYLCESCSVTLPTVKELCDHMKSTKHNFKYLTRQYPRFMYWTEEELDPLMSDELTDYIAWLVKGQEESADAQTVLLSEEWFKWVRKAPIAEALNVVQMIKQEKKMTSLPPIVTSQHEVEQREQQRTQTIMDTNILADLPNKTEICIMEKADCIMNTPHEASSEGGIACENADLCTSATDTNCMSSSQITEFFDSQSDNVASTNSPMQPDDPTSAAAKQNFVPSPKDANQDCFKPDTQAPESEVTSPLNLILAEMSPLVDAVETKSLEIITNTSTHSKPKTDIHLCSPSVQEASTVSPNHIEENITEVEQEDQIMEESSPHCHSDTNVESTSLMPSSTVDQNVNEYPARDPDDKTDEEKAALDKHYYLMLINLLKQTKNSMQEASTRNQLLEPCTAKASESTVEPCEELKHTQWDIGQPPKTDTDPTDNVYTTETNKSGSSAELQIQKSVCSGVSNENTGKPMFVGVIPVSSENETRSELEMQSQGPLVESKDDKPVEESRVKKPLEFLKKLTEKETKIQETETENNVLDLHTPLECQSNSAEHSEIKSLCSISQQRQQLQVKSDIQNTSSNYFTQNFQELMKTFKFDCRIKLQTQQGQVQVLQQTQKQEFQVQSEVSQSLNPNQQNQKEQGQSNTVLPLQLQTQVEPTQHVTQQTQGHTEEVPIYSLVTSRRPNTMRFRNDVDDRQTASFQAAPPGFVASSVGGSMVATGDNGQYAQTAYPTNVCFSYSQPLPGVHHGSYPSHIYYQPQAQQHGPFVQPFLHNVQHPGLLGWFTPNTQLQPGAHNTPAWCNGSVGGTNSVAYSDAASFNTLHNQSYTYHRVQEYNRVTVQNLSYQFPMPPQTNSQFFPPRQ